MSSSLALRAWTTTRRTGRWTCWWRPTPRARCSRRCSSPSPTCSTSRSTCCTSTPPRPTSKQTAKTNPGPVAAPAAKRAADNRPCQGQGEQRLDGKYLLATSDPDLSAEDVALGYKNLLEAERGFRDLKSQLLLRPVFHRLEHRIRAHVLLCWLALLLTRVAERACEQTWQRINRETSRDRKSTRLNSSHPSISYAVFCLKK